MKRLVLLTLILIPSAIHVIGSMSGASRSSVTIGPRTGRARDVRLIADRAAAVEPFRVVRNLPSATPDRAREDAWRELRGTVGRWLTAARVPEGWSPPDELLRSMVQTGPLEIVEKDYGTIYVQPLILDVSDANRDRLVEAYERDLAGRRLARLAGVLAFVLTCLGAVTGYIRADEATLGYYTNTLRAAALGTIGAVGAVLYLALA